MNEPVLGRVVVSRAGHDKGRAFLIVGVSDESSVLLADGVTRKAERPKKKKLMHVQIRPEQVEEVAKTLAEGKLPQNASLNKALSALGYNKNSD